MPAVKRASSSTAGRPSAAKKPASGQAKIGFAARKGSSSSTAAAGSSKKPPQVAAAAVVSSEQQQPTRSSPRRKTKTKTKVDVVDLLSEDEQRASDEDEAALEALADLERRPSAASTPSAGRPKATPAGRAVETALEEGGELQPKDKRWTRPYKEALDALGGNKPIHCEDEDRTTTILRVFDNDTRFGPATSISRLARWERASKWGLNPPGYVKEILLTKQGKEDPTLRETVFYARI